jgi:multiple sugar transport system substrate-binding protein
MRRRRPAAALCLLLAAAAAACGGSHQRTAPLPTSADGGYITVASGLDVTGSGGVRQQLIEEWNRTREGSEHKARLVELPGDADAQRSQLLGALQSGSATYDVVNLDITWVPEFATAGLISPLDPATPDTDIIPAVAATGQWGGHTYALPFNSDVGLLYYRKDYLAAVRVDPARTPERGIASDPLTGLLETVHAHSSVLPKAFQAAWTSQLAQYEGLTVNAVEAFASAGVRLTDDRGHYTAGPADLRKGLRLLQNRTQKLFTLDSATQSREPESLSYFAAGRTAFLRHWPYAYGQLLQTLRPAQIGVLPLPGKAVLGGQDLAVSAASPRARYALDLVRYLTGPRSERCLLDAGFAATRESAYTDDAVTCPLDGTASSPPAGTTAAPGPTANAEQHPMPTGADGRPVYAQTVRHALASAVQRPRTPYYGAFTEALQSRLYPWLTSRDQQDIDQEAKDLDTALKKALSGR